MRSCLKVGVVVVMLFRDSQLQAQLAKSAAYGFNTASHRP